MLPLFRRWRLIYYFCEKEHILCMHMKGENVWIDHRRRGWGRSDVFQVPGGLSAVSLSICDVVINAAAIESMFVGRGEQSDYVKTIVAAPSRVFITTNRNVRPSVCPVWLVAYVLRRAFATCRHRSPGRRLTVMCASSCAERMWARKSKPTEIYTDGSDIWCRKASCT